MAERVVVFIDSQNTYRGARRAFFGEAGPHINGNIDPLKFAQRLVARERPGGARELADVRVYTGRPDASKSSKAYAAHLKQAAAWRSSGVTVIQRTLRYPRDWPKEREREKGIDVAII